MASQDRSRPVHTPLESHVNYDLRSLFSIACALALVLVLPGEFSRHARLTQTTKGIIAISIIHTAETEYNRRFGRFGLLADLELSDELTAGRSGPYNISLEITKDGYRLQVKPRNPHCCPSFHSDQTMVIHSSDPGIVFQTLGR
jgi:hypothetical protein